MKLSRERYCVNFSFFACHPKLREANLLQVGISKLDCFVPRNDPIHLFRKSLLLFVSEELGSDTLCRTSSR